MKLNAKKYLITAALLWTGCFVLFLFMYMLVLAPQRNSSQEIQKQLADKEQIYELALQAAKQETQNQMDENIKSLRDELSGFVIKPENLADLIFDISQVTKEKQVDSSSVKSEEKRGGSSTLNCRYLTESCIDLSFVGDFNQFATLLNTLERHSPVIFVDEFSMTQSRRTDTSHQVNMDLAVFVEKQQEG